MLASANYFTRLALTVGSAPATPASGTIATYALTGGALKRKDDAGAETEIAQIVGAPASASATGRAGQIAHDADYIYICTAADTWKRAALSTW